MFIKIVYTSDYNISSLTGAVQFSPVRWKVTSAILFHIFANNRINVFVKSHTIGNRNMHSLQTWRNLKLCHTS